MVASEEEIGASAVVCLGYPLKVSFHFCFSYSVLCFGHHCTCMHVWFIHSSTSSVSQFFF